MSGNKKVNLTNKKYWCESPLFDSQLSSADGNTSLNEFQQKCVSKLKLNKRNEDGDTKTTIKKTFSSSECSSNATQDSQTSLKSSLVGKSKIKDFCSQESLSQVGKVSKIDHKPCPGCGEKIAETVYSSHMLRCLQKYRSKCPECNASLTKMTTIQSGMHINRCQLLKSETDSSPTSTTQPPIILECPFCGKYNEDPQWRKTHILKCAKSKKISVEKYRVALDLQEKHARERSAAGLSNQPAKPVINPKTTARSTARQRTVLEPTTYAQEDLQMAKAMSLSLQEEQKIKSEEENFFFQALSSTKEDEVDLDKEFVKVLELYSKKKSSKKLKTKKSIPLLFLRSDEDRKEILAERVAEVLSEDKNKYEMPSGPFNVNWKDTFIFRTWPNTLQNNRLWNLTTRSDANRVDITNFYTPCFLEIEDPREIDINRCKRISSIPGYKLQPSQNESLTEPKDLLHDELATQDVVDQLLQQNFFERAGDLESDEEMRDGFITQKERVCINIEKDFTQNEEDFAQKEDDLSQKSEDLFQDGEEVTQKEECHKRKEQVTNIGTSLSKNLLEMVDNPMLSDVKIHVDGDLIMASHRFILFARCPLAFQELKKEEDDKDNYILNWSEMSYNGACAFLKFIYAEVRPESHCVGEVTKLARRYKILELLDVESKPLSSSPDSLIFAPGDENIFSYDSEIPAIHSPVFSKECADVKNETESRKNLSQSVKNNEDEVSINFGSTLSTDSNLDSDAIEEKLACAMSSPLTSLHSEEEMTFKKRKLVFDDSDYELNLEQRIEKRRRKENENNTSSIKERVAKYEEKSDNILIASSPYSAAPNFSFQDDSLFERAATESQEFDICQSKLSPKLDARKAFTLSVSSSSENDLPTEKPNKSRKKTSKKAMTPMPHYSIMETPEITKNLKSIGVKNIGKKKGTQLLKHVFKETHKDSEGKGIEEEKVFNSLTSSPTKRSKKDSKKSDSESTQEDLNQQLEKFIKSKKEIHLDALHYNPIVLENLHKQLTDSGIKCNSVQLKDFLDRQCLAYTSLEEKFVRKKRTSPRKNKNSPSKKRTFPSKNKTSPSKNKTSPSKKITSPNKKIISPRKK